MINTLITCLFKIPHSINKYQGDQDVEDKRLLREITKMVVNKRVFNQSFTESQKLTKLKQTRSETGSLEIGKSETCF